MSILFGLIIIYVAVVIAVVHYLIGRQEQQLNGDLKATEESYKGLVDKKNILSQRKLQLENETLRIFTLYDITKEITKSLHEREAFEIFKEKLMENVVYKECRLLEPLSSEVEDFKDENDFVFPLQEKNKRMGYLIVRGLPVEQREDVMILGHQFALALRRVKLYEEIEKVAITDSLTDVGTRRHLTERFQEELNRAQLKKLKLSLMMIDVDFFKSFNDKYGHLTGDQILREVGMIIKASIREIDIAGRYGGEEFCIILPDTDSGGAQLAAERIRRAAEQAVIRAYDATVKITVSIGVATFPHDGMTMDFNYLCHKHDDGIECHAQ